MGTHWEQEEIKKKKKIPPHALLKKDINWTPCECMLRLLIGCMKAFIFKIVCQHFWLMVFLANAMNCVGERHSVIDTSLLNTR
jgi:hypothetical protein